MLKNLLLVPLLAACLPAFGQATPSNRDVRPHDIQTGVLAFECANYTKYFDDEARYQELMIIGREKVVGFLNAYFNDEITDQEFRDHVPLDVMLILAAPTPDFAAGRIFQSYSAFVEHWVGHERNPDGSVDGTRPREPWERQVEEARRLYSKNKCHLID